MKQYIRIIIPILIFVVLAGFILFFPEDTSELGCKWGDHSYTVENLCSKCGDVWEYTEGLEFKIGESYCTVVGKGNANTADIVIPYGHNGLPVIYIGEEAFENDAALKSVKLPYGIKSIGSYSFSGCTSLEEINIPGSVISISTRAFQACSKLEKADFETYDWYVLIGDDRRRRNQSTSVFEDGLSAAKTLRGIYDHDMVFIFSKSVADSGFVCEEGEHIYNYLNFCDICQKSWVDSGFNYNFIGYLPGWNRCEYSVWSLPNNETEVVVPRGINWNPVTQIDERCLSGRKHIKTIMLPDTIEVIGEYAFEGTGITEIVLPSKLTAVSAYLFKDCTLLTEVYIPKNVTNIAPMAFNNCTFLTKVVFEDPDGWEIIGYDNQEDVFSDPAKAAEYLKGEAGYYPWKKSGS